MPLFWRLFLSNASVLLVAVVLAALTPVTISNPVLLTELAILAAGVLGVFAVNALVLRRALRPLRELVDTIDDIERPGTGGRVPVRTDDEVGAVARAYNAMLDRLEREREGAARIALEAQEGERHRVATELHDSVGQSLTVLILGLKHVADQSPPEVAAQHEQLSDQVRSTLAEVREISARLRPGVLRDLGLGAALRALTRELRERTALDVRPDIGHLPELGEEQELVVYRIVQEALTNVVRHAQASTVDVTVSADRDDLVVSVVDDGVGRTEPPSGSPEDRGGSGIMGMRERARLVGGALDVGSVPTGGTRVTLRMPITREVHA